MNPENRAAELHEALDRARAVRPGEHVLIIVARITDEGAEATVAARLARGTTVLADDAARTTDALARAASEYAAGAATRLAVYRRGLS